MSIFYDENQKSFYLGAGKASYVLHVDEDGRLLNQHWGVRVPDGAIQPDLSHYPTLASFDPRTNALPWELPTRGSGWYGEPAVAATNAKGDDMVQLTYVSHAIYMGKNRLPGLPATFARREGDAETLEIELMDRLTGLRVTAVYGVFERTGAITRSLRLKNESGEDMQINGVLSASAPVHGSGYDVIHLKGAWARERHVMRQTQGEGEYRIFSQRGASGHEANPFLALCEKSATEFSGEVWAVSLVYSGSFEALSYVNNTENSRLSIGLNPDVFTWKLEPGETFVSPEAAMVYSPDGLNGMSHAFHRLYSENLMRSKWFERDRPILINNWEATYFNFNEEKILQIARRAKELGVEMLVLDDGWFGKRNTDNCSLGDWVVNPEKLPGGLNGLSDRLHDLGLKFGLWFEPEMISPDSDLYRAHPDWCLHVDGRARVEMRNQLILDLSRREVQDYIIESVSAVLESARIEYVKWDMNRNMTEPFSGAQTPERQKETQHRYMLGLYRVLEEITARFPEILFESCSGGGGRFDPGMLYYMPQTWTSDDSDAVERMFIQYGTSFVYPPCAMGAHVSAVPNHQTGRTTAMQTRGDVALGGNFGFELDLSQLSDADAETVRRLIEREKQVRTLVRTGEFTRLLSPFDHPYAAWQFRARDNSEALVCAYRLMTRPATPHLLLRASGLDESAVYMDDDGNTCSGAALTRYGLWLHLPGDFTSKVIHLRRIG
ncbi:MAG: alpha-galactosidase [Eubacteriales bacterium]|nr:alpha-galactosidase [Eubacteriales bacterium]